LIVARQRAQLGPGFLVEVGYGVSRDAGIEPVGLGEHDIEGDYDGAERGELVDQIGDPGPGPGPLAKFRQALFVDVDNGDRPCRLHPGLDHLEGIEGPEPDLLDRKGIGDAQGRESDQERQAQQPRHPEPSHEPPT
jgi:hypothetical protein